MRNIQTVCFIIGRIFLSLIFLLSSFHKFLHWQSTESGLTNILCDWMGYSSFFQTLFSELLPWSFLLLFFAVIMEFVGGALLLLGIKIRLAAILLILFLIPTTVLFHHFWFLEGIRRELELVMFLKNLAIIGGLFYFLAFDSKEQIDPSIKLDMPDLREDK